MILIRNADVYAPEPLGRQELLVSGNRIHAVADHIDLQGEALETVDATGCWLVPGFVDALTHPCGGGGEGGFGNRTEEIAAAEFIAAGVTTPVGALGTDSVARSLEVLYGKTMELRANGISALMYTGAYRVPAPTLTGDIARDMTLVEPVIGVGEVAISDHRSSQPGIDELRRLAADTSLGGTLSGSGGTVLVHVGDGPGGLGPLREALSGSDLPTTSFYPTHVNRNQSLLTEAADFARAGGFVDITASTTPELIAAGDLPPLQAWQWLMDSGVPAERVTVSSDAGGSLPVYVDGELHGLTAARPDVMLELLWSCVDAAPTQLATLLGALTSNPATALGLADRGRIGAGLRADLLLLDVESKTLRGVMAGGRWLMGDD